MGCVWFLCRNMELRYWLVPGNVKNNWINWLNEKRLLIPLGLRVPIWKINFCSRVLRLSVFSWWRETTQTAMWLRYRWNDQWSWLIAWIVQLFQQTWLSCFCCSSGPSSGTANWLTVISTNVTKREQRENSIHSHISPSQPRSEINHSKQL